MNNILLKGSISLVLVFIYCFFIDGQPLKECFMESIIAFGVLVVVLSLKYGITQYKSKKK